MPTTVQSVSASAVPFTVTPKRPAAGTEAVSSGSLKVIASSRPFTAALSKVGSVESFEYPRMANSLTHPLAKELHAPVEELSRH